MILEIEKQTSLRGKLYSHGGRCWFCVDENLDCKANGTGGVRIKCPGLAAALEHHSFARMTNGRPMVSVDAEIAGVVAPGAELFAYVLESVSQIVLLKNGSSEQLDLSHLTELTPAQQAECEMFEQKFGSSALREKYLDQRKSW